MVSRHIHVLAGRVGSQSRSKKINMMLDEIDKAVSQAREKDGINTVKISASHLATELNYSNSEIYRNGYPEFFKKYMDSVTYKENQGLFVEVEKWVEERKEQREKINEVKN